jgi:hypothetical protein
VVSRRGGVPAAGHAAGGTVQRPEDDDAALSGQFPWLDLEGIQDAHSIEVLAVLEILGEQVLALADLSCRDNERVSE